MIKRQILEERESSVLAAYAVKSAESKGRKFPEPEDDFRMCFQRDKGRVIHSKAFRRLSDKTQVLIAGSGDHYRTRLTHTLEVAQISRDIARRLGLNEDLCEVIALAHDLGHPPFGHAGEVAVDEMMKKYGLRFEHNAQSRLIVEKLEKAYPDFEGLNLSLEVLEGLMKHKTPWDQAETDFEISAHLEAQVVNLADEIAYNNHDIDDGLRTGLIGLRDLEGLDLFGEAENEVFEKYGKIDGYAYIARIISAMMSIMISNLTGQALQNIEKFAIKNVDDVRSNKEETVCFSKEMRKKVDEMRGFLRENFYMNPVVLQLVDSGKEKVKTLFQFYMENPDKFPKNRDFEDKKDLAMAIKDYISGMTDDYLAEKYEIVYNQV